MPLTASRLMTKIKRAHRKIKGADQPVSLVKTALTRTSDFKKPVPVDTPSPVDPPPIVYDQPNEQLAPAFGTQIAGDEKIFVFATDTVVAREPIATLSSRAVIYLRSISGLENGHILYGSDKYAIVEIKPVATVLGLSPQIAVLAKAALKSKPE